MNLRAFRFLAAAAAAHAAACGEPPGAKGPTPSRSATPVASNWPGVDPADASLDLTPAADAGARSDCVPSVPNDGNAAHASPAQATDRLGVCLAFSTSIPESPDGRICYDVNLTTGIYERHAPFAPATPDEPLRWLASHDATSATGYVVKTTAIDVTVCKGADCQTIHPDGLRPLAPKSGESCLRAPLLRALPADLSPDASLLFVVRHESCSAGMQVYGETYDVKKKRRLARAPLRVDGVIDTVGWLGQRILLRDCNEDGKACEVSIVDPKAPPPAARTHLAWNGASLAGINPGSLERFFVHAKDDLWALIDRTGASITYLRGDDGKIERKVQLPAAPEIARPLLVGLRPPQQIYLFYGGAGRIILFDLPSGQIAQSFSPPFCNERTLQ